MKKKTYKMVRIIIYHHQTTLLGRVNTIAEMFRRG